jgi:CRISPR/Cas system-associated protein Csm6
MQTEKTETISLDTAASRYIAEVVHEFLDDKGVAVTGFSFELTVNYTVVEEKDRRRG